ncbi:hypothetical protein [Halovivax cerinus]|uniref:Zn-dependent alcohol dehydrogenase n=1 Tax=Halovivax cerinus TaxID=1487865 RepID=A0ABD5NMJ1_9EURY|nr:hypothetical protein [Halovivax cerinus]
MPTKAVVYNDAHDVSIDEASEMYERFDEREEGVTKVLLEP